MHSTQMREEPKIPRIVKKIYLKYSYKFKTLVRFKVLPLWWNAVIPAPLPLLKTFSKIFNWNAFKGHQQFLLNPCNISKTPTFQTLLHSAGTKKKVADSEVRGKWVGVGELPQFCF